MPTQKQTMAAVRGATRPRRRSGDRGRRVAKGCMRSRRSRARPLVLPLDGEEGQVWLALAAQQPEVDLDAADPARLGDDERLRLYALRHESPAAGGARGVEPDAFEVARELLDRLERRDPLDLDRDPLRVLVAAHQ